MQIHRYSTPASTTASPDYEATSPAGVLFAVARKYPFKIAFSILAGFSGGLFSGVGTALIVPILLTLLGQNAILQEGPPIFHMLLSPFSAIAEPYRLGVMSLIAVLLVFLKNVSNYLSSLASNTLARSLTSDLQRQGLRLILDVDLEFFSRTKVGELVNLLGGEMNKAASAITASIRLFISTATILVFLGLLLAISWQLTVVATFLLPASSVISQFISKRAKALSTALTKLNAKYSGGLVEMISGIRLVKAAVNEEHEYQRFIQNIEEREALNFKIQMNSGLVGPTAEVVNTIVLFILVLLARALFRDQISSLSAIMVTYLVLLSRLLPYIGQLNNSRNQIARVSGSINATHDLLDRTSKTFMQSGQLQYQCLSEGIEFKDISFTYPGSKTKVLDTICLSLPKGKTLALVGASGAGKSTLADLLPRFFDPTEGAILLDGCDLREFDLSSVRMAMGIVSQDTFLFNNTVRYNIAYGRRGVSDEEIIAAAKLANAYEFIAALPNGLDTSIGDRGVMLSGGQRQRLAIARALLQNPEILILDEATSALDTVSERLVQQAIDELSRDRTTLVIAHRLSTVQKADQIAVLEKGRVVELGTHDELLQQGGPYRTLCTLQFDEPEASLRPELA